MLNCVIKSVQAEPKLKDVERQAIQMFRDEQHDQGLVVGSIRKFGFYFGLSFLHYCHSPRSVCYWFPGRVCLLKKNDSKAMRRSICGHLWKMPDCTSATLQVVLVPA